MKSRLALLALLLTGLFATRLPAIDPYYHTLAEINDQIYAWQQMYPDTVAVYTVGYSQLDHLPILAVKLTDHPQTEADKAKVLFVGQVHAEEILGVEVVMSLMDSLLTKRMMNPYKIWLDTLEIWCIPTANPEGHQVVMADTLDDSYRKNKRDCNLNGIFDFHSGTGGDSDGVDINRNFPLNWIHGDSYLIPGGDESYDYFRGFAPLSESETQALWTLGGQKIFAFSIVWHSSRTGNNSEKVFFPWNWDESGKYPPDYSVLSHTGENVANSIPTQPGSQFSYYLPYDSKEPRGQQHDAYYAQYGTIAMLIECGNAVLQPPQPIAIDVVKDNLNGAFWVLNRASGYGPSTYKAQITGKVTDASGNPLLAEVTILEQDGPLLAPRLCNSFGRYRRYVISGTYTVRANLRGYYPQQNSIFASTGGAVNLNFTLQSKPAHIFAGQVSNIMMSPLPSFMYLNGEDVADTVLIAADGLFWKSLPEGAYQLIFDSPGYVVRFDSLNLDQDRWIPFQLSPAQVLYQDSFESGLNNWNHGGTPDHWGTELADSLWPGGWVASDWPDTEYVANTMTWLEKSAPLDLSNAHTAALKFQHWYYLEPGYDSAVVQVSEDNGGSWQTLCGPFDLQDTGWETAYGNLNPYCGQNNVRLRWLLSTDGSLQEQGWRFDDVQILTADTTVAVLPDPTPHRFSLIQAYPNPFNSQLAILLDLPQSQEIQLSLWDIAGRQVANLHSGLLAQGLHRLAWLAPAHQATGLYLLRFQHGDKTDIRKILYLK